MAVTVPRRVFAFWLGDVPMSDARKRAVDALPNSGVPVEFLTDNDLDRWILPAQPLHPAWKYLTAVHRADYLRTYLMHHHGGGYSDLKLTRDSWLRAFDLIDDRRLLGAGYGERAAWCVATMDVDLGRSRPRKAVSMKFWYLRWLQLNYQKLIGTSAFIFLPGTRLTSRWFQELQHRLDVLLPELEVHPAREPRDRTGKILNGVPSPYPVSWTHLLGDIFHPLTYRYRRRLSRDLPPPSFEGYE